MKPARTRLPPADRRVQLLGHAVACFAEHGVARATQAQVAARAGVLGERLGLQARLRHAAAAAPWVLLGLAAAVVLAGLALARQGDRGEATWHDDWPDSPEGLPAGQTIGRS